MIRRLFLGLMLLGVLAGQSQAGMVTTFGFTRITNNSTANVASQLAVAVYDQAGAQDVFGVNITPADVLFAFANNVGTASSIREIYFDDNVAPPGVLLNQSTVYNNLHLTGGVNFVGGSAIPGNLPGGKDLTPKFEADAMFSADTDPQAPKNGVDKSGELVGISFTLEPGASYNSLISSLSSGALRIGLHVVAINGVTDENAANFSDSFINNPNGAQTGTGSIIPEPASLSLWALGGLGLVGLRRRRA